MNEPFEERNPLPRTRALIGVKVLVGSAVALMLSAGLCGASVALMGSSTRAAGSSFLAGLTMLALGLLGVVVGTVWAIIESAQGTQR